jgi:hypothetical protein
MKLFQKQKRGEVRGSTFSSPFQLSYGLLSQDGAISTAKWMIKGLIPDYIPNGVPILQYADDTILCMKDDEDTT